MITINSTTTTTTTTTTIADDNGNERGQYVSRILTERMLVKVLHAIFKLQCC